MVTISQCSARELSRLFSDPPIRRKPKRHKELPEGTWFGGMGICGNGEELHAEIVEFFYHADPYCVADPQHPAH